MAKANRSASVSFEPSHGEGRSIRQLFWAALGGVAVCLLTLAPADVAQAQTAAARVETTDTATGPARAAVAPSQTELTNADAPTAAWLAAGDVTEGKVAFYGRKFAGRKTASGERFSHEAMTMAHKTLPFGTWVRVTNLNTQRSVVVRVNDRGPFIAGRIADVTRAAGSKLQMGRSGVIEARLEVIRADQKGRSRRPGNRA